MAFQCSLPIFVMNRLTTPIDWEIFDMVLTMENMTPPTIYEYGTQGMIVFSTSLLGHHWEDNFVIPLVETPRVYHVYNVRYGM